jgi:hypothetical protein
MTPETAAIFGAINDPPENRPDSERGGESFQGDIQ